MRPGSFGEESSLLTLRRVEPRAVQSAVSSPCRRRPSSITATRLYTVELKPTMSNTLGNLTEHRKAREARIYTGLSI